MKRQKVLQKIETLKQNILKSILLTFVLFGFISNVASAAPNRINFQAKIKKPDGSNLEAPDVSFRFKYINAGGTCTLYMEDFNNISMFASAGNVSFSLGSGAKVFPPTATDLSETFSNTATNTMSCYEGGNYTPLSTLENRKLRVEFVYSGSGGLQALNGIEINSTPYAMYASDADKLAGFAAALYLKFSDVTTCTGGNLLQFNGTAFSCIAPGAATSFTGSLSGDVSGTQAATVVDTVGGKTAAQISTSVDDTLNATSNPTASRIVKRDASGNASFSTLQATDYYGRNLVLFEPTDSNYVTVKAPTTFASGNYVLTLPNSKGLSGQVLSTDGNGVTSWIPAASGSVTSVTATPPLLSSGGATPDISMPAATAAVDGYLSAANFTTFNNKVSSQWSNNVSDIFFNSGNVGIGTNTPSTVGSFNYTAASKVLNVTNTGQAVVSVSGDDAIVSLYENDGTVDERWHIIRNEGGKLQFTPHTDAGGSKGTALSILNSNGNVGIANVNPAYKLDVTGDINVTGNFKINGTNISNTPSPWLMNVADTYFNTGNVGIGTNTPTTALDVVSSGLENAHFTKATGDTRIRIGRPGTTADDNGIFGWNDTLKQIQLYVSGEGPGTALNIANGGDVGIGTTTPEAKLDVRSGLKATNNVLAIFKTTDAQPEQFFIENKGNTGVALQATEQFIGNNNLFLNPYGGNVGVGTFTPSAKFQVDTDAGTNAALSTMVPAFSLQNNSATDGSLNAISFSNRAGFSTASIFNLQNGINGGTQLGLSTKTAGGGAWNTDQLILDPSGNIGMGTIAPAYKLDVAGDINVTGNFKINGTNIASGNMGGSGTANKVSKFSAASTLTDSIITDDGTHVGIGTSSPTARLTIQGASVSGVSTTSDNVTNYNSSGIRLNGDLANSSREAITYSSGGGGGAAMVFERDSSYGTGISLFTNSNGNGVVGDMTKRFTILSTGSVGIGVASPVNALDVAGDINVTGNFKVNGVNVPLVATQWTTNGTNIYNNNAGNVGIGVSTPLERFQVQDGNISMKTSGATTTPILKWQGSDNSERFSISGDTETLGGSTDGWKFNNLFGYTSFVNSNVESMHITSDNKVGIGTSTPAQKLDVQGSILIPHDQALRSGTSNWIIGQQSSPLNEISIGSTVIANDIRFDSATSAGLVTIKNTGNVGIGAAATNPAAKLEVAGDINLGINDPNLATVTSTYGNKLFFLGANFNSDPFWMARYNVSSDASELRMNIGDNPYGPVDKFVVGNDDGVTWNPNFVVQSDGKVGIGVNSPAYALDVVGDLNITGSFKVGGTNITSSQWTTSAPNIYYNTGNVGIGTNAPSSLLHVKSSSSGVNGIMTLENDTGAITNLYTARSVLTHANKGVLENSNGILINPSGGNVGIGMINPTAKLNISGGQIRSEAAAADTDITRLPAASEIVLETAGDGATSAWLWREKWSAGNYGVFHDNTDDNLLTVGNGNTVMSVGLSSLNVGVGVRNPTEKFEVNGVAKAGNFYVNKSSYVHAQNAGDEWLRIATGASNSTAEFRVLAYGSAQHGFAHFYVDCNYPGTSSQCVINMMGRSDFGTYPAFKAIRVNYQGTYDPYYVEILVGNNAAAHSDVYVETKDNSNFTVPTVLTAGSIPAGYSSNVVNTDTSFAAFGNGQLNVKTTGVELGADNSLLSGYGTPLSFLGQNNNSDPLWMARYNSSLNVSELRVNIGDDPGSGAATDRFVIGTTTSGWNPAMTVMSDGKVGIGLNNNTPSAQLHTLDGDAMTGGYTRSMALEAAHPTIQFKGHSTSNHSAFIAYDAMIGTEALNFWVNGTTDDVGAATYAMRIRADGNVGIGTGLPTHKLDVDGDINIAAANSLMFGGTPICTVGGCVSPSDLRLKENVKPLENSLSKILRLQGVEYDYKDKAKFGDKHQVGVIAQDVEKVFPEVVVTSDKTGLKAVAYDHLVAPVIEAIKSLYARILDHDREIASVKAENNKLKQENSEIKAYLCSKDPNAPICK